LFIQKQIKRARHSVDQSWPCDIYCWCQQPAVGVMKETPTIKRKRMGERRGRVMLFVCDSLFRFIPKEARGETNGWSERPSRQRLEIKLLLADERVVARVHGNGDTTSTSSSSLPFLLVSRRSILGCPLARIEPVTDFYFFVVVVVGWVDE